MASESQSQFINLVSWRTQILTKHLIQPSQQHLHQPLTPSICLQYSPPELSEHFHFDTQNMRDLLDSHNVVDRDWLFGLMIQSQLFCPRKLGGRVFVSPDYNQSMEQQRKMTMKRIAYLLDRGVFEGWLFFEVIGMYDYLLAVKIGVHLFWGWAIQVALLCLKWDMEVMYVKVVQSFFSGVSVRSKELKQLPHMMQTLENLSLTLTMCQLRSTRLEGPLIVSKEKSDKEIMREIQAIMRQIASSITYLPCLDEPCVFDVLAYTDKDVAVPFTWIESDPKLIANPQMIYKVDSLVSYKNDEWDEQ